ncbi:MAG: permease prefix domain 1-containing protein, partial [Streptosporangiaceae bacterium]
MTSPLITSYVSGLRRRLPAALADEAAAGLLEAYEHHLAAGAGDHDAARGAVAEFGDLAMVVSEFTRQAPG